MRWRATLTGCHDDCVRFNRVNEEYNLTHSYVASIPFTVNRYQAHTHTLRVVYKTSVSSSWSLVRSGWN